MIKILKNGNTHQEVPKTKRIYTVVCSKCGCTFECENEDFGWLSGESYPNMLTFWVGGIECPCCKEDILVLTNTPYREEKEG